MYRDYSKHKWRNFNIDHRTLSHLQYVNDLEVRIEGILNGELTLSSLKLVKTIGKEAHRQAAFFQPMLLMKEKEIPFTLIESYREMMGAIGLLGITAKEKLLALQTKHDYTPEAFVKYLIPNTQACASILSSEIVRHAQEKKGLSRENIEQISETITKKMAEKLYAEENSVLSQMHNGMSMHYIELCEGYANQAEKASLQTKQVSELEAERKILIHTNQEMKNTIQELTNSNRSLMDINQRATIFNKELTDTNQQLMNKISQIENRIRFIENRLRFLESTALENKVKNEPMETSKKFRFFHVFNKKKMPQIQSTKQAFNIGTL